MSDKESKSVLTRRQMILAGAAALAGATLGAKEIAAKAAGLRRAASTAGPLQRCFYFNGTASKELSPVNKTTEVSITDELIHKPGLYKYNEFVYDCTQEGLYHWIDPYVDSTQRIVYDKSLPSLLSSLSWITAPGTYDEALLLDRKTEHAKRSKLRLRCGYTIEWAVHILNGLGFRKAYDYRVVRTLTGGTPNGYDDGHIMLEVKIDGVWTLWDILNNLIFKKDGEQLNLKTLVPLLPTAQGEQEKVQWTNKVNVIAPDGNLAKKSSTNNWDAGAISLQIIPSGDGYVEFKATETNTYRLCGLSNGDKHQYWTDIDFGWYLQPQSAVAIFEFGRYIGEFGKYEEGTVFRISVENGAIKYWKNGELMYTSQREPTYPLLVDTSLMTPGATLTDVGISNESMKAKQTPQYEIQLVADDGYSIETAGPGNIDITRFTEALTRTPALRQQWCNRIFQIPFIDGLDGYCYFYLPEHLVSRRSWVPTHILNARELKREMWESWFYSS